MRQVEPLIDDVRRVLDRSLHCVVLDLRERLVRQTNLGRWLVAKLEADLFSRVLGVPVRREEESAGGLYRAVFSFGEL